MAAWVAEFLIFRFSVRVQDPSFYLFLRNYIHSQLSFNFILDPGLIVAGLMVVLSTLEITLNAPVSTSKGLQRLPSH